MLAPYAPSGAPRINLTPSFGSNKNKKETSFCSTAILIHALESQVIFLFLFCAFFAM